MAAYLAEHLAGDQIDDLRPYKKEKGGNVKYCERFSAGHQRKRKEREHTTRLSLLQDRKDDVTHHAKVHQYRSVERERVISMSRMDVAERGS